MRYLVRVIDFHTHAFPDAIAATAMPALEEEADVKAFYDGTIAGLLASMDAAGIEKSVLQPVATKPSQVVSINDWTAAQRADRFIPFGAMHPLLEDPRAEIERMASLGIRGMKLHPEYQHFDPDEPAMDPIYEAARDAGMIILFHAGVDIGIPTLRGTPVAFANVLDDYPGLKVVLAHMGGFRMWAEVAHALVARDVWFDTAYSLGRLADEQFVDILRSHGPDRVLFGSDAPWTDQAAELEHLRRLRLTEEELEGVLWANAERLLAL